MQLPSSSSSSREETREYGYTLHEKLLACAQEDTSLGRAVKRALSVMRDAYRLYGPDKVVASFNGGKDAVVILHLALAALAAHAEATGASTIPRLRVIFFEIDDDFPEIEEFVRETTSSYNLDMVSYSKVGFADGLKMCIAEHGSAAFVLGTRESDPNAVGQQDFAPSSDWMPPFMRVNPILTWSYADVWDFLRGFGIPYCALYDDGYTSLGKVASTQRNPALLRADGTYGPAWELVDGSLERAGRGSKPQGEDSAATASAADPSAGRLRASSAALLLVGDEILGGKVADVNTLVAAKELRAAGVALRRVAVVADVMEDIVEELRRLSQRYDVVLTSGGLGPTHDDITLKGVAKALGVPMERSASMAEMITSRYTTMGRDLPAEVLDKMAILPKGARMRQPPDDAEAWPVLQCANVFVLPGVPDFFAGKLAVIASHFLEGSSPLLSRRVQLNVVEETIVNELNGVVASHPRVSFGSYPVSQGAVQTIVTLEAAGSDNQQLEDGLAALVAALPDGSVVEVSDSESLLPVDKA